MTCQHCQTWNGDEDHRCHRCGRRLRSTPARISPDQYPIAATATARAYDFDANDRAGVPPKPTPSQAAESGQQALFSVQQEPRVIPFDSLTSQAARESIRARAAEVSRPSPVKTGKVEVSPRISRSAKNSSRTVQRELDFFTDPEVSKHPQSTIICDAPVAPAGLRVQAALVDALVVSVGCCLAILAFHFVSGTLALDKHSLPFVAGGLATIALLYKLIWPFANRDTIGMRAAGVRLVDFDGNPPTRERRYQRAFGSIISTLAAGVGLVWALVDEDGLTWHDHMSSTFPTLV